MLKLRLLSAFVLRSRAVLPAASLLLLAGCKGPPVESLMPTPVLYTALEAGPLDHIPADQRWKPRRVYFATTRERTGDLQRIDYGNREGSVTSVGMALIGFGDDGVSWSDLNRYSRQAERPEAVALSIAGLVEAGDLTPDAATSSGAAAWLVADLNAAIGSARDRDLMIYVHGAKVNFYNACAFAAQLDHFMGRDMTSLAFSWPTRQNIVAYGTGGDVERAYRAAPALRALLELLARESVARRIHVVSWRAGARVVTAALRELYERHADGTDGGLRERFRIGTAYFAASDVPAAEFVEALPALDALTHRIVVTASSNDGALEQARRFMGGGARLGQVNQDLPQDQLDVVLTAERLEVIDVSRGWEGRGFDITGHRYWIEHPWASSDLILAVRSDLGPRERALEPTGLDILWALPADYPERLRRSVTRPDLRIREPR